MFAYRATFFKGLLGLLLLAAALVAIGCGAGDDPEPAASGDQPATEADPEQGADPGAGPSGVEPDVADADPEDVEVITGWVDTLSGGDVEGAAEFFAQPSIAENGPLVTRIRDLEDAVAFNESLPCGAEVISAETSGQFTTATFRLFERPGGDCGPGAGGAAATSFVIENGKIAEWRRVGAGGDAPSPGESTT